MLAEVGLGQQLECSDVGWLKTKDGTAEERFSGLSDVSQLIRADYYGCSQIQQRRP